MSTRILVVDDTVVFRRVVSDALAGIPGVEVIGTAANGRLALSRIKALEPDLVTLDIEMPELSGIEVLEAMSAAGSKTGVILLSAVTVRGGELTVRALELGAFDFVTKPEGGTPDQNIALLRGQLTPMIRAFEREREAHARLRAASAKPVPAHPAATAPAAPLKTPASPPAPTGPVRATHRAGAPIVVIGISTGGPSALASMLPMLPGDLHAPVFVVQHMPPMFTEPLAASLNKKCALQVKEAVDGERPVDGCVYIAPGGRHMKLARGPKGEIIVRITDDPPENNCRPAVDYLFRSVALQFPGRAIAAILTGMGSDGTEGLRLLKRGGCFSVAQDEASCVVFGMPKEAIGAGVVDVVAPLDMIAGQILRAVREAAK